jgi:transcription elongation factor
MIKTIENVPIELKVKANEVEKYFETGESVRIISGTHAGDTGIIASIIDNHAVVSMDASTGSEELKILLSNLQSKKESMDHIKLRDYIQKSVLEIKYQAGDLILYNNYESVGYIVHVYPDYLRVLSSKNVMQNVK